MADDQTPPPISPYDPTQSTSPYYIRTNDGTGAMLVTHNLDANNYYSWTRSMRRALRIKNKLGFIDGTLCEPADLNDPLMEHWLRCNDIVILDAKTPWLLTSNVAWCMQRWLISCGSNLSSGLLNKMHQESMKSSKV